MMFDPVSTLRRLKTFWRRDEGAVTVDWVVLTAAIAGLAIGIWLVLVDSLFVDGGIAISTDINEAVRR
ncbi:MAG: hypothetical protein ACK4VZ_00170 [Paracoccaceae bacterium]